MGQGDGPGAGTGSLTAPDAGGEAATGPTGHPAAPDVAAPDVYEVFRQDKEAAPMQHVGSVRAPDAEMAGHYARDLYGRRQEAIRLWVVARAEVHEVDDPDWLQPPFDRSFKKPAGYSAEIKQKLAVARQRAAGDAPRLARDTAAPPRAPARAQPEEADPR
jgi:ring-1,2-phenylacetyl-CoA epoxidase subunit PaaB